jgi:hypothetical protein
MARAKSPEPSGRIRSRETLVACPQWDLGKYDR